MTGWQWNGTGRRTMSTDLICAVQIAGQLSRQHFCRDNPLTLQLLFLLGGRHDVAVADCLFSGLRVLECRLFQFLKSMF
jgi:hypothetical protein